MSRVQVTFFCVSGGHSPAGNKKQSTTERERRDRKKRGNLFFFWRDFSSEATKKSAQHTI